MAVIPFSFGAGAGVNIVDSSGNVVQTPDNISLKDAQTYTPSTSTQTIPAQRYLRGAQTIKGDANLIASNIRSGVNLFGVVGTLVDRVSGRVANPISTM